ncbi:MAG: TIGR01212 family radical SAM protein [Spirochaetes bacterium]|nr:TIGR01212 family radical SAM protein [Spirochaetota bacterium]
MTRKRDPSDPGDCAAKPYRSFGDHLLQTYGRRVLKIPINANLSCPNREGNTGGHGCIFCSGDGSASPGTDGTTRLEQQIESAKKNFKRAGPGTGYIAYFQAYTNTYASPDELKHLYDRALSSPGMMGLMIGTRPDCLPDDVLDLIASYMRPGFELWLEIGMQSAHDRSLELLRRRHSLADTIDAVRRSNLRGIPVCAHLILGIPGETWNDMMDTAIFLRSMPLKGLKLHHLHVIRGTPLEEWYRDGRMVPLSLKEYASLLCDFLERVSPDIIIHRLMGDRDEETLIAPHWSLRKGTAIKAIEEEFRRRDTYQGFLFDLEAPQS